MTILELSNCDAPFIFTDVYKDSVQSSLKNISFVLQQQCDPDMPCTFCPSGYLPDAHDDENNYTGENGPWNERCFIGHIIIYVIG